MNTTQKTVVQRDVGLDALRILAIFMVIVLHVSSFGVVDTTRADYSYFFAWNSFARPCVALFFMISGRYNLAKDRTCKEMLKKMCPLAIALVAWSGIYTIPVAYIQPGLSKATLLSHFVLGHYHLWFLYALLAFYALTPIFRAIARDKNCVCFLFFGRWSLRYSQTRCNLFQPGVIYGM